MKKLLSNKFWKQGNLLNQDTKNMGETNLSLILFSIQPFENIKIF